MNHIMNSNPTLSYLHLHLWQLSLVHDVLAQLELTRLGYWHMIIRLLLLFQLLRGMTGVKLLALLLLL